jgi:signal transduction histidine kinase
MRRSGFVDIDVADLAAKAAEFYLPAAELKNVNVSFRDPGPVFVRGDRVLLAQAINNLVDNAIKYVSEGGRIAIEVLRRPDGAAGIVVADDGPGIPDTEKPKAAQRFYRGDASRGTPGVGLGLSLVEAIAKLHDGGLELADNHPGLRAQMTLQPGAQPPPPAQRPVEAAYPSMVSSSARTTAASS